MSKKILYLLRHAKSSWDEPALSDIDRPLNRRGEKAAPLIGEHMKKVQVQPDRILVSPAKRTRQTAKLALAAGHLQASPEIEDRIYAADSNQLMAVLAESGPDVSELLIVGHNPGMESLQEMLTGSYESFATATLARIELKIDSWSEISGNCGTLSWIVRPRELIEA